MPDADVNVCSVECEPGVSAIQTLSNRGEGRMDFGLCTTWNAVYVGDKVPWDADYRGGKLLEAAAYAQNWQEVQAVEDMGWDYIWLGGGHFSTQGSMDPQPLMLSAAIASRTRRIKIGTSIHRSLLRPPGV